MTARPATRARALIGKLLAEGGGEQSAPVCVVPSVIRASMPDAGLSGKPQGCGEAPAGLTRRRSLSGANNHPRFFTNTYDPLDNMRTSVIGSRSSTHNYNATTNQLTSIVNSSGTTGCLTPAANAQSEGAQQYVFDLGNRMQSATGIDTFYYDVWFRRTFSVIAPATNQVWLYSQSGQLLYW